ncbi:conserved hypothetical protein [Nostocoides japonicum T1-X7]|uniref:Integral membrane protein n=1 Tax=Nostocoides japonicum T1-X7 TaxID=1194083 RepID=A0A077LVN6_9MICO|nr:DUF3043 domain-containing protein [Tetrasphaera japonica]CCH76882.1 conserved hypothetical protein [Tetrasphaera japonica T1-X7]
MFGRDKTKATAAGTEESGEAHPVREGAKNRPTPKRKDQEAARKQPLVITDRKAARSTDKVKRREQQLKMRQAMVTGDDRYLPARDKGPVRRYVRDYVDARWSVGEFLLPVMILVLALTFVRIAAAYQIMFIGVYGVILLAIIDSVILWQKVKKRVRTKFAPGEIPRGLAMYAIMRSFQMRRMRMPKPQVARGQYPA